jgi:hypothetical protein
LRLCSFLAAFLFAGLILIAPASAADNKSASGGDEQLTTLWCMAVDGSLTPCGTTHAPQFGGCWKDGHQMTPCDACDAACQAMIVAIGNRVTSVPPHRSEHALLTHSALALGV